MKSKFTSHTCKLARIRLSLANSFLSLDSQCSLEVSNFPHNTYMAHGSPYPLYNIFFYVCIRISEYEHEMLIMLCYDEQAKRLVCIKNIKNLLCVFRDMYIYCICTHKVVSV